VDTKKGDQKVTTKLRPLFSLEPSKTEVQKQHSSSQAGCTTIDRDAKQDTKKKQKPKPVQILASVPNHSAPRNESRPAAARTNGQQERQFVLRILRIYLWLWRRRTLLRVCHSLKHKKNLVFVVILFHSASTVRIVSPDRHHYIIKQESHEMRSAKTFSFQIPSLKQCEGRLELSLYY
jgi:hypothetical protein